MKSNLDADHRARAGAERRRDPRRHGSAAELRTGVHRPPSGRRSATSRSEQRVTVHSVPARQASRATPALNQARRHPPERPTGPRSSPRPCGTCSGPRWIRCCRPHDRAARRLQDGAERHAAPSRSFIPSISASRRGTRRRDHRARRAAASRRCSGCSPGSTRPSAGQRRHRRRRHHGARRGRPRAAARSAHRLRLPVLPPAAVADRARERAGADGDRRRRERRRGARDALLAEVGPRRSRAPLSVAALGRRAAARRDRARARQRSAAPAGRRADRQSRQPRPATQIIELLLERQPDAQDDARAGDARSGAGGAAPTSTIALRDGRVAPVRPQRRASPAGGGRR